MAGRVRMRRVLATLLSGVLIAALHDTLPGIAQSASDPSVTDSISSQVVVRARSKKPGKRSNSGSPAATPQSSQLAPRVPFTAAEDDVAVIPGMPDARFWADSTADFIKALPAQGGPWLTLSSGGSDGAFGAGLLSGWSASGRRPEFSVVTGVSTGALMAPFAFAGARYDEQMRAAYTGVTAADIFEAGGTGESFLDTWPLRRLLEKQITPQLMADIAAEHRRGRRLFVVTTNLDADRFVVWNMGAIAAHGGDDAARLFRSVLLASSSIPGAFPPVLIDVESGGKRFQEMHADGGMGGQFFVAPAELMAATSSYRLPATQLYIVVNTGLGRDFKVVDRTTVAVLGRAVGTAVKVDTRLMIDRAYEAAKRSAVGFNVATIDPAFDVPSRGMFDPAYMRALFDAGFEQGKGASPFAHEPPPYSILPTVRSEDLKKAGATR
jgi:predicted acylesterase/phospholipase RssA